MALLEERKRKLAAEGLFAEERKRKLPFLPRVVGIVTSPTGAVIRDMLHGFNERFPTHVVVWPVRVQGETSASEVAAAIRGFNAISPPGPVPRPDVLIVARGGGSLEDLWGFNEEVVVRAVAESRIPLISAVGHETDWTLIDLAADARAPTPTKAAEWAVQKRADLVERVLDHGMRLRKSMRRSVEAERTRLSGLARALPAPQDLLAMPRQRLDAASARLPRALYANTQAHANRFARLSARLQPRLLGTRIARSRERLETLHRFSRQGLARMVETRRARLDRASVRLSPQALIAEARRGGMRAGELGARLKAAARALLDVRRRHLASHAQMLASLSYQSVLKRGFAILRDESGAMVRSAATVAPGSRLDIELADGHVRGRAEGDPPPPRPATASRPPSRGGSSGQGQLF
jgi:exodeoxyribonuclease VII large subunit